MINPPARLKRLGEDKAVTDDSRSLSLMSLPRSLGGGRETASGFDRAGHSKRLGLGGGRETASGFDRAGHSKRLGLGGGRETASGFDRAGHSKRLGLGYDIYMLGYDIYISKGFGEVPTKLGYTRQKCPFLSFHQSQ